jgi:hypothetical protein
MAWRRRRCWHARILNLLCRMHDRAFFHLLVNSFVLLYYLVELRVHMYSRLYCTYTRSISSCDFLMNWHLKIEVRVCLFPEKTNSWFIRNSAFGSIALSFETPNTQPVGRYMYFIHNNHNIFPTSLFNHAMYVLTKFKSYVCITMQLDFKCHPCIPNCLANTEHFIVLRNPPGKELLFFIKMKTC